MSSFAMVAKLVSHLVANQETAGSSPAHRSKGHVYGPCYRFPDSRRTRVWACTGDESRRLAPLAGSDGNLAQ